jgi:hypothetical protein
MLNIAQDIDICTISPTDNSWATREILKRVRVSDKDIDALYNAQMAGDKYSVWDTAYKLFEDYQIKDSHYISAEYTRINQELNKRWMDGPAWINPTPKSLPPEAAPAGKKYIKVKIKVNHSKLPIINHTWVVVKDGRMTLTWINIDTKDESWKSESAIISGVFGECNICLPSKTLKDILRLLDGYKITITKDSACMRAYITTQDSKITILGIDPQEWPSLD